MVSGWKEYKLEEVSTVQTGPFGSQLHQSDYKLVGTPIITVEHLGENKILHQNIPLVCDEDKKRLNKYVLEEGDIVFSRVGSVDRRAYVSKNEDGWMFSGRCLRVRVNKEIVDPKYLSYYFGQESFKEHIRMIAVGATMPSINTEILSGVGLNLPDLPEQHSITSILRSLDDKIDLLHRQNKTLEALAETLFRQWFVEEAEEGWEKKRLGNYIVIKHGYAFKGDHITTEETEEILLTPGNFKIGGGFNFDKCRYYNDTDFPSTYILEEGNLIVTMTDLSHEGDTLGYPAFVPSIKDKYILHNQRIGKVLFKENHDNKKMFFYWLMRGADYRHYILGSATGTTVRHTSPSTICDYEFTMPNITKLEKFEGQIKMLQEKETFNHTQIRTLTRLRDTLLPKLMSGEVRVKLQQEEAGI